MTRPARVVTWNGKDVPAELRELSAGRYVVEPPRGFSRPKTIRL
jgi:hypothetical protein